MLFNWLDWSNPVAMWWIFLVSVSVINILIWFFTVEYFHRRNNHPLTRFSKLMLMLSAAYVFGCAFRSFLPRADVQRIAIFDTWFSSVLIGRGIATIAEISFVAQWALILNHISKIVKTTIVEKISFVLVPLIFIAECFSWYAVVRTHYLGNTFEESIWAVTYSLITICLIFLWPKFKGSLKYAVSMAIAGCILYITFMVTVDVPMYIGRWQNDIMTGKLLLGFTDGIRDLGSRWIVTHSISDWKSEIPWMSLYFSVAVWTSLALCYVPHSKERISKYLVK